MGHKKIVVKLLEYSISRITELTDAITKLRMDYNVPLSNIIADEDGVGGGLIDILKITGFVNNSRALNNENYSNIKTQCIFQYLVFEYEGEDV